MHISDHRFPGQGNDEESDRLPLLQTSLLGEAESLPDVSRLWLTVVTETEILNLDEWEHSMEPDPSDSWLYAWL